MRSAKQPYIVAALVCSAAAGLAALYVFAGKKSDARDFPHRIAACSAATATLRFSCYRSVLETFFRDIPQLSAAIQADGQLKEEKAFISPDGFSYAVFGTNCHTFYHAVGDFIASHAGNADAGDLVRYCPTACTSGCVMGLYKRTALEQNFSPEFLKRLYPLCNPNSLHQCAHEIGHILHDKYTYPILGILDVISKSRYGLIEPVSPRSGYGPAQNPDVSKAFEECKALVPTREWPYCFTGIGHNLFLFSEFSTDGYKSTFQDCERTDAAHREDCYKYLIYRVGINEAAPRFLAGKYAEANKICADVTAGSHDYLKNDCYLGVGGGIGLYIDSDYSFDASDARGRNELRTQIQNLAELCENSDAKYVDKCYIGLMGTPFKKFYQSLNISIDRLEKLLPTINSDFQVVG